ncbi:MAG TPA: MBL fold metallo-hydrolase [Gammaproteobacteria bacterium]|nr:MBL fold metallo-hydrolase [Gammaproteobacteria bacterium]
MPIGRTLGALAGATLLAAGLSGPAAASDDHHRDHDHQCQHRQPQGPLAVRVLGSGGPVMENQRASAGYVFYVDGEPRLLMDAGGGTAVRLGEARVDAAKIDAVMLSHLHIDHSTDLPAILKSAYFQGRGEQPIDVYGPTGGGPYPSVSDWLDGLYAEGSGGGIYRYMHLFAKQVAGGVFHVNGHDIDAGLGNPGIRSVYQGDGVSVQAVPVKHGPAPALAYRVDYRDRSITFSGDLNSDTGNLVDLARGTDVLIYDTSLNSDVPKGTPASALHSYPAEVGKAAAAAGARTLVLSHLMPPALKQLDQVVATVAEHFDGRILVAHDGMLVEPDRHRAEGDDD